MSESSLVTRATIIPTPDNLAEFVPYACGQLMAPFRVRFQTRLQEAYVSKSEPKTRKSQKTHGVQSSRWNLPVSMTKVESVTVKDAEDDDDSKIFVVEALMDSAENVIEISIGRCSAAPRLLMQIIALCLPFNPYLNKISMHCRVPGETLHETVKLLTLSHITEVCLDDSRILAHNYYVLLERQTHLRSLSLARCNITDDDCSLLVPKLEYPQPASKTLKMLNLTGNYISDKGARYISQILRSNRCLLYLNLCGNVIGDDGAIDIVSNLMEFRVTADEILMKRRRSLYLIKLRKEIYAKCYMELLSTASDKPNMDDGSRSSRRKTAQHSRKQIANINMAQDISQNDQVALKAEKMTTELMDSSPDPFRVEATVLRNNCLYSTGNLTLTYLNLAYNNLGYQSVVKLLEVARYQTMAGKQPNLGLLSVKLEGNPLPVCTELNLLADMFTRALQVRFLYSSIQTAGGKRVDRIRRSRANSIIPLN